MHQENGKKMLAMKNGKKMLARKNDKKIFARTKGKKMFARKNGKNTCSKTPFCSASPPGTRAEMKTPGPSLRPTCNVPTL